MYICSIVKSPQPNRTQTTPTAMLMIPFFYRLNNNQISKFFIRPPPWMIDFHTLPFMFYTNHGTTINSRNESLMSISLLFLPKKKHLSSLTPFLILSEWLLPKQTDPTSPIDTFFLSRHIHEHEERLGWPKRITCHSFRHALGTHLYENSAKVVLQPVTQMLR